MVAESFSFASTSNRT